MATPPNSAEPSADARAVARTEFVSLLSTHGDSIPLTEAAAWMCAEERGVDTISPIMDAVAALSDSLYIPEGTPVIEAVARPTTTSSRPWRFAVTKTPTGTPTTRCSTPC